MPKFMDLTGQRFTKLVVLERAPNRGKNTYWKCLCDCGSEKEICAVSLRNGETNSCGKCGYKQNQARKARHKKVINLKGKVFGRLTVLGLDGSNPANRKWICRCVCGKIKKIRGHSLTSGAVKSCSCWNKDRIKELGKKNYEDLLGQRFGKLLVVEMTEKRKRGVVWLCQCECGNKKEISASDLKKNTKSCGCNTRIRMANLNRQTQVETFTTLEEGCRFGMLTFRGLTTEKDARGRYFLSIWECDCGKFIKVPNKSVTSGRRSCGCAQENKRVKVGQKIGLLTLVSVLDERENQKKVGLWDCDCGTKNHKIVIASVKSGNTTSCGCIHEKHCQNFGSNRRHDLKPGFKLHRLTLVKVLENNKHNQRVGLWDCDCGTKNHKTVIAHVMGGHTRSCGCIFTKMVQDTAMWRMYQHYGVVMPETIDVEKHLSNMGR
jgi:hypothetical protein